jgi:hypothetical protein
LASRACEEREHVLLAGVPVYVFMKWRGARAEPTEVAAIATAPSDGEQPLGLTA